MVQRGGGGGGGGFIRIDDDVFYLFLQKQKLEANLHIYLEKGTYHKRLFRGPNTNDMKKWDGPSLANKQSHGPQERQNNCLAIGSAT